MEEKNEMGWPFRVEWRVNAWVILLALFSLAQWFGGSSVSASALEKRVQVLESGQAQLQGKLDTIRDEVIGVRVALERVATVQEREVRRR